MVKLVISGRATPSLRRAPSCSDKPSQLSTLNRLNHVWLLLAYFGVFLIVILSLVPGTLRPHTGASGSMEHLAAYTLVATAFGFALANTRQAFVYGIGLIAVAGLLEELQHSGVRGR
jgi:hypothetical protein